MRNQENPFAAEIESLKGSLYGLRDAEMIAVYEKAIDFLEDEPGFSMLLDYAGEIDLSRETYKHKFVGQAYEDIYEQILLAIGEVEELGEDEEEKLTMSRVTMTQCDKCANIIPEKWVTRLQSGSVICSTRIEQTIEVCPRCLITLGKLREVDLELSRSPGYNYYAPDLLREQPVPNEITEDTDKDHANGRF